MNTKCFGKDWVGEEGTQSRDVEGITNEKKQWLYLQRNAAKCR